MTVNLKDCPQFGFLKDKDLSISYYFKYVLSDVGVYTSKEVIVLIEKNTNAILRVGNKENVDFFVNAKNGDCFELWFTRGENKINVFINNEKSKYIGPGLPIDYT